MLARSRWIVQRKTWSPWTRTSQILPASQVSRAFSTTDPSTVAVKATTNTNTTTTNNNHNRPLWNGLPVIMSKDHTKNTKHMQLKVAAILKRGQQYDHDHLQTTLSTDRKRHFLESVGLLQYRLTTLLQRTHPGTRVEICGSCMSGLFSLESDVDISLHIPNLSAVQIIMASNDILKQERREFTHLRAILQARIPVLKGRCISKASKNHQSRNVHFDICANNDMAVVNSKLLLNYTMVHETTTKAVMLAVKHWAKKHSISSANYGYLSSYAWTNMAIFYLQHIGLAPNLQCPDFIKQCNIHSEDRSYYIDGVSTAFAPWQVIQSRGLWHMNQDLIDMPVSLLLHGFFYFYAHQFPRDDAMVSIRFGGRLKKLYQNNKPGFFSIEDPFRIFGSPVAHDLSRPVRNVEAQQRIIQCLLNSEADLRRHLLEEV